ncbi:hypothetical protein COO60DRAFT_1498607 [Scenedesmus sp. NREL 46B-D3]|nr:hypothetical protein COO60DRAFT_1498607 [Scenedesmus sp. NREL 46B-D3]
MCCYLSVVILCLPSDTCMYKAVCCIDAEICITSWGWPALCWPVSRCGQQLCLCPLRPPFPSRNARPAAATCQPEALRCCITAFKSASS